MKELDDLFNEADDYENRLAEERRLAAAEAKRQRKLEIAATVEALAVVRPVLYEIKAGVNRPNYVVKITEGPADDFAFIIFSLAKKESNLGNPPALSYRSLTFYGYSNGEVNVHEYHGDKAAVRKANSPRTVYGLTTRPNSENVKACVLAFMKTILIPTAT